MVLDIPSTGSRGAEDASFGNPFIAGSGFSGLHQSYTHAKRVGISFTTGQIGPDTPERDKYIPASVLCLEICTFIAREKGIKSCFTHVISRDQNELSKGFPGS